MNSIWIASNVFQVERFLISIRISHHVQMFNQNNAIIKEHQFENIVRMFCHSASFCVRLFAVPKQTDSIVMTPNVKLRLCSLFIGYEIKIASIQI